MILIYIPSGVTRGALCSYFTSNVKVPHIYRQDTLIETFFASVVNPGAFITEMVGNLIYMLQGSRNCFVTCRQEQLRESSFKGISLHVT